MYTIEQKDYGIKLTFAGFIRSTEMTAWHNEITPLLEDLPASFGMFIDMRKMTAMPAESQKILVATQKQFKTRVERSATITESAITNMQSKRMGKISGVDKNKLFIDATEISDWEDKALYWITKGENPFSSDL